MNSMSRVITYNQIIQDYVYHLALMFRANNQEEQYNAWNGFCKFRYIVQEAIDVVDDELQYGILNSIQNNILGTLSMYEQEIDFKQILSKMHSDLDDYKKLLEK